MNRAPTGAAEAVGVPEAVDGDHRFYGLLDELVSRCVDVLAADAVVVLLGDSHDQLRVAAASADVVTVEPLVLSLHDNPYVQCYRTATQVRIPDIDAVRSRWPEFVVAVERACTSRSVHVLPMRRRGVVIGALSVFHRAPDVVLPADLVLGQALADTAAVGIVSERAIRRSEEVGRQMRAAHVRRVEIEQAKGIVGHCRGVSTDQAFVVLRDHAHRHDLRLSDLAHQIATHALDPDTLSPAAPRHGRHRQDG